MSIVPTAEKLPAPAGARELGVRTGPILRLGMGRKVEGTRRDGTKYTRPEKTDYFTVRGDARAVAKFRSVYGDQPKSIRILLQSSIASSLSIQYRAFKGGQGDEGGALVAVGHTNFALGDYCGGPDILTVWNQDGTVATVETAGLDAITREPLDDIAKDLGLELYTTLRAGMPDVLGFGSFFELATKGKQSTDNLWSKLREIYAIFGTRAQIAISPNLVIRPASARPVVVKDGKPQRIRTQIFVADVVVTESIEESFERLRARNELLAPQGPAAALYGPAPVAAIEAGPQIAPPDAEAEVDWEGDDIPLEGEDVEDATIVDEPEATPASPPADSAAPSPAAAGQQAGGGTTAQTGAAPAPDPEPDPTTTDTDDGPGAYVVPSGTVQGYTLAAIAGMAQGPDWFRWASSPKTELDEDTVAAVAAYLELHPELVA